MGSMLIVLAVAACYGSALLLTRPSNGTLVSCVEGNCFERRLSLYEACKSQTTSAEHHTFGFLSGLASALFFCPPKGGRGAGRSDKGSAEQRCAHAELHGALQAPAETVR